MGLLFLPYLIVRCGKPSPLAVRTMLTAKPLSKAGIRQYGFAILWTEHGSEQLKEQGEQSELAIGYGIPKQRPN